MKLLLLSALAWCAGTLIAAGWLRAKLSPRATRLTYVFLAYIWLIGAFSQLYYYVYSRDHSNFVFASDVLRTRKTDVLAEKKNQLEKLGLKLNAINQLSDSLAGKKVPITVDPRRDSWVTLETDTYRFEFDIGSWGDRNADILILTSTMEIVDKKGKSLGTDQVRLRGPSLSLQKALSEQEWDRLTDTYFPPRTSEMYQEDQVAYLSYNDGR
jgi:hypothetical protein